MDFRKIIFLSLHFTAKNPLMIEIQEKTIVLPRIPGRKASSSICAQEGVVKLREWLLLLRSLPAFRADTKIVTLVLNSRPWIAHLKFGGCAASMLWKQKNLSKSSKKFDRHVTWNLPEQMVGNSIFRPRSTKICRIGSCDLFRGFGLFLKKSKTNTTVVINK